MPEVSVIVPIYNAEKYLRRCVDSILSQTFTDFELILVDDGSPDNSGKICDDYALKDSRIKVIHQKNSGGAAARNTGADLSGGKYIAFIDSDDYISEEYLKVLYDNLTKYDADISVVSALRLSESRSRSSMYETNVLKGRKIIAYFCSVEGYKLRTPWAKLIKRDLVRNHPFPTDRSIGEDMSALFAIYTDSHLAVDSSAELYYYDDTNDGSLTNRPYSLRFLGTLETYEEIIEYLSINHFDAFSERFVREYLSEAVIQYQKIIDELHDKKNACLVKRKIMRMLNRYWIKYNLTIYNCGAYDVLLGKRKRTAWKFLKKYKSFITR